MALFNVTWEIEEIEADSPLEAAHLAQQWIEESAQQYYVQNLKTKKIYSVDLQEEDGCEVLPVGQYGYQSVIQPKV